MAPRPYSVEFEAQTVATASGDVDLFEFDAAAEKPIELVGLFLAVTSEVTTNVGEDEFLRLRVIRGHTTTGNGTSTTPRPLKQTDAAAGFVAETNGATIASAGSAVNLHSDAFNVRTGFQFWWPEGWGPDTSGASLLVVRLMAAVADDVTMSGTAYILEYG
jgi:chitodextrinase